MFLLCAERLLKYCDMALVVLVLLLQRLHLGCHRQYLLVPSLDLQPKLVQLLIPIAKSVQN